jgi:hypothetical protein
MRELFAEDGTPLLNQSLKDTPVAWIYMTDSIYDPEND